MSLRLGYFLLASMLFAIPSGVEAQDISFNKTKQEYQDGEKTRDRDVALVFSDDQIVVKHRKRDDVYAEIPNSSITDLTYERSKHPRVKTAIFLSPLALFSPGKKHWFTIQYTTGDETEYVLLQLDKNEYQRVILEAETKTGKKVERVIED